MECTIRPVTPDDIPAIHAIFSHSVLTYTASWDLIPPDEAEMRQRVQSILAQGYPYFVAMIGDSLAGYSYASSYRSRPGYRFTVENSIYVDPAYQRRGIARQLLTKLIHTCTEQGYRQMIAVIGDSENHPSIRLHQDMGFEQVGFLPNIGYKFDRWLDSVVMQKALGSGSMTQPKG